MSARNPHPRPWGRAPNARDRLVGFTAALGLVAIVVGLPAVLLAIGANPLPDQAPNSDEIWSALTSPDDGTLVLRVIAVTAWVAWAFMAISVLIEVLSQVRGVRAPQLPALPGLRLSQGAARSLVGTAALLFIAAPALLPPGQPGTTAASAVELTHASPTTQAPPADHLAPGAPADHLAPGAPGALGTRSGVAGRGSHDVAQDRGDRLHRRPTTKPHRVGSGESLWSIARTHLDDGARYPEIVALNRDVLGEDPGFLEVGWVLLVPDTDQDDDKPAHVDLKAGERVVTVKAHDTLSEIAETELDDPTAYPQIFEASKNITQPGGVHLSDPDMIDVGWTLVIPPSSDSSSEASRDPSSETRKGDAKPDDSSDRGPETKQGDQGAAETPLQSQTDPLLEEHADAAAEPRGSTPTSTPDQGEQGDQDDQGDQGERGDETQVSGAETTDEAGAVDAPWLLIGLTGGGAVLAAGLYRGLKARRRAQWRARRPGRAVALPGPELAPVEKTINTTGAATATTVEFMDEALRRLAGRRAQDGHPMPAVAAVELNEHSLTLHLTDPIDLDTPWEGTADRLHWRCGIGADFGAFGLAIEEQSDQPAPYPMLVTIGSSDDGDVWLLNCEELAAITIIGDDTYGRDLVRYLAAELAVNPWSEGVVVDCLGIAEEVAPMERDRIRYHHRGPAGDQVVSETLADAVTTIDRSHQADMDVVTGRSAQVGADVWPARLLLIDTTPPGHPDDASPSETAPVPVPASLAELLGLNLDHAGHTGTAVVIAGATSAGRVDAPGTMLHITSNGRVQLAEAGLDLVAVGLTSDEAHGCAALLAQSEDRTDTETPVDESAEDGWEAYTTQSGSLRTEYTLPRGSGAGTSTASHLGHLDYADPSDHRPSEPDTDDEQVEDTDTAEHAESVLKGPDEDYVTAAAATTEDLAALAPDVSLSVRAQVKAADPTLDDDVAAWFTPGSNRPKLTLLGPVSARAHGKALTERKAYYTELLTYLALRRRHGATPDEVADAFNLKPPKTRGYVKVVRDWLGTNPATGTKHLPDATAAPATKTRGVNVYQIDDGLLIDADLFRRLWARGQSRGPAGIHDLRQALDLVVGRPFDQLRKGAWSWLLEGDRTDLQMQAAVADVAHLVATYALTTGDLDLARTAVEKAMLAAPDEDTTQLNRAALAAAEGFPEEAERILRDELCNRTDDGRAPLDLTERAEAILRNHDWLATG